LLRGELARRLRRQQLAKGKRPLLIAVSGYGDALTRRHSQEAGVDLHLHMPVDSAELD
jgi:CheY-like chemotaxis protein